MRAGVGGAVLAPPRHRQAAPCARAAARVRERGGVAAVRQEMGVRTGRVRRAEPSSDGCANRRHRAGAFRGTRLGENRLPRHALLQEQFSRLDPRIGVEPRHEDVVVQHVGERDERHPLVVGEKGAHDFRLAGAGHRRRVDCRLARLVVE